MRRPADGNVPSASIARLRRAGRDIEGAAGRAPGVDDAAVPALAASKARAVVTFDRDFGDLVFSAAAAAHLPPAVVHSRFVPAWPEEPAGLLQALAAQDLGLAGHFVVRDRDRYRKRPLPARAVGARLSARAGTSRADNRAGRRRPPFGAPRFPLKCRGQREGPAGPSRFVCALPEPRAEP